MKNKSFEFKQFSRKQQQLMFWWDGESPYKDKDIVIADGAVRSGKTIAMICSFLLWSNKNFSGEDFIIAGKSMGALKRNVIKPMQQILQAWNWGYEYVRSGSPYIVIGQNQYHLFGASNDSSQDTLQGLTAAGAYADEAPLFPKSFIDQMIARCSVEGAKIFMNDNPQGPYHYFKEEFIDMVEEKNIYYLHFDMDDNLTLSNDVKERYKRMFTGVFYQRYINGLWVMAEGVIFDVFDEKEHVVKTEERLYSSYYLSIDYGTHNPFAMGLWGNYKGVWYMVKEYYYDGRKESRQKTDDQYYNDLCEFLGPIIPQTIIIDPSAASFITLIKQRGKYGVLKAKNDVLEGIANTSLCIQNKRILFNDCCVNMFKEFSSYVWDEKAADRGEDKPVKANDHLCDQVRYFCHTMVHYGKIRL